MNGFRQAINDLCIRRKIQFGYALSLAPLALLGGLLIWVLLTIEHAADEINHDIRPDIATLDLLRDDVSNLTDGLARYLHDDGTDANTTATGPAGLVQIPPALAASQRELKATLAQFAASPAYDDEMEIALWSEIYAGAKAFSAAVDGQLSAVSTYDHAAADAALHDLMKLASGLNTQIEAADAIELRQLTLFSNSAERLLELSTAAVVATFAVIGFLSIIIGRAISRRISQPIQILQAAAARIGEGRFDVALKPDGKDEIGSLVSTFDRMRVSLDLQTRLRVGIFDAIGEGICIFDPDARLVSWNRTFESLWRFPTGFLQVGMPFDAILRHNAERGLYGREDIETAIARRRDDGLQPGLNSEIYRTPDGTTVERRRTSMSDGGWISSFRDVTESENLQRALIESEMRLRGFMHNSPVGMTVKDIHGRYTMVNPMIAGLAGRSAEEMIDCKIDDIWPAAVAADIAARDAEVLRQNATTTCEQTFSDGARNIWIQEVRFPIRDLDDRTVAIGNIILDITERKRAEAEFREADALIRGFMENAPVALSVKDTAGHFLMINGEGERAFGRPAAEIIGKRTADINPTQGAEEIRAMELELLATNCTVAREIHNGGRKEFAWVYEVKFPIRDADGSIKAIGGCALDITERKLAEQALRASEAQLSRAQKIAKVGHWVWSGPDYSEWSPRTVRYSDGAAAIFGVPAADLVHPDEVYIARFVHPDDRERMRKEFQTYMERRNDGAALEYRIVRPDGAVRTITVMSEMVAVDSGRSTEIIGTIHDVTERKQIENELLDAKDLAEQASLAKSQFLANMSHELRTPLNAIIGFSEIMTSQLFGQLTPARYLDCAADIEASGRHLLDIVNDVLDTSRIEAGTFDLQEERCDIRDILTIAGNMVAHDARQKSITIRRDIDDRIPAISADPRALRQVFINLLSNAVKFTPEGGSIRVEAIRAVDQGLLLRVIDDGIGIAEEHVERIFDRFVQIDDAYARIHGGVGLGLHITKRLIELHGGTIRARSKVGMGAVFEIHLPRERILAVEA